MRQDSDGRVASNRAETNRHVACQCRQMGEHVAVAEDL